MQVMPATEGKHLAQKSKLAETLHSCLVAFLEPEVRAWRGEARLGTVFWFHGVLVSSVLIAFYISSIYRSEALLEQALLICFGAYTIWILVSIWRCSLGADPFWGLLARWLTVAWAANAALVLLFRQLEIWIRYAET